MFKLLEGWFAKVKIPGCGGKYVVSMIHKSMDSSAVKVRRIIIPLIIPDYIWDQVMISLH